MKNKNNSPSLSRAALYIRVSTEEQVMHGYSLEAQKEALTRYAKENNLFIVDYYIDEGKSARGKIQNRKAFQRLMADVEADKIDLILFIKLDRWFRPVKDYYKTQEILEKHHVNWRTTEEQYDTSTANGRLYINIRLVMAQDEADRTSDRIKFVFASKVARGEVITGKIPLGFKIENKRLVHDPETVDMVRDLFARYQLCHSKRDTMYYMFQKYGVTIYRQNLSHLLSNPLYKGEYRGVKDYCEPIIPPAIWNEINAVKNIRRPSTARVYIFSGLLVCAECGLRMAGRYAHARSGGVETIYYRCRRYAEFKDCANRKLLNEAKLEQWLLDNIEDKIAAYLLACQTKAARKSKPIADSAAIQKKLTRLKDLYVNEMIDMETYRADYETYTAQLAQIQEPEEPTANIQKLKAFLQNGFDKTAYQTLSREERRSIWRGILKEIRIDAQKTITISFF